MLSSYQHRRQRRALSLRRYTWARDARLDGIGPAHEARHPARGSLRAQRGRSDLDCAQTAARPRALNDGLWLRAANFGGHTAQDQRHRPRPYAVASTRRQGSQGTRTANPRPQPTIYGSRCSLSFVSEVCVCPRGSANSQRNESRDPRDSGERIQKLDDF